METNNQDDDQASIRREAKLKGKVPYGTWLLARYLNQDPTEYAHESSEISRQKRLEYSAYVRYNEDTSNQITPDKKEDPLAQKAITLDDIKQLLIEEREHTRQLVREEVQQEVGDQFQGFIEHNFQPFMDDVDQRFDRLEDRVDHLAGDVAELRIDTRHIKQVLRTTRNLNPSPAD